MKTNNFGYADNILQTKVNQITIETIFQKISSDNQLKEKIEFLRKVKSETPSAYAKLKQQLPYFTVSKFKNDYRRLEFFDHSSFFIVDIDHFAKNEMFPSIIHLKETLKKDPNVMMLFTSPGGDGLKILVPLEFEITGTQQYSQQYKYYINQWAEKYQIEAFIDFKTIDATRATFLSYDENAYLNINAQNIKNHQNVQQDQTGLFSDANKETNITKTIDNDVFKQILLKLETKPKPDKKENNVVIPEILNELKPVLEKEFNEFQIHIVQIKEIQYGLQIDASVKLKQGCINIFYGKNGFSVMEVNKKNTDKPLNEILKKITEALIFSRSFEMQELIKTFE